MIDNPMDVLRDFPIRKTKKQKQVFQDAIQSYLSVIGYDVTIEKGKYGAQNIIFGDPDSAAYLVTAHYDTPAALPIPNLITPCSFLPFLGYQIVLTVLIFLIALIPGLIFVSLGMRAEAASRIWLLSLYVILALMLVGPGNKNNANDNTSGVVTLLEIYERLTEQQRAQAAFVFFDNEEIGLLGSSQFKKKHEKEMENKLLINFDCVADGDHFLLAITKDGEKRYGDLIKEVFCTTEDKEFTFGKADRIFYPSDHIGFPNAVAVAAFHKKKFIGHYIGRIHTGRDTVFDERNIELLTAYCAEYLEKTNENIPVA